MMPDLKTIMRYAALLTASALWACGGQRVASRTEQDVAAESRRAVAELRRKADEAAAAHDYTRAEQYLDLALAEGGDPALLVPMLIEICVRDQRYRSAIQHGETYLRKHPGAQELRFVVAALHAGIGEVENARRELETVLVARPRHADAHFALAVLLRDELGSRVQADAHFREYLRLRPDGLHAEEARGLLLEVVR